MLSTLMYVASILVASHIFAIEIFENTFRHRFECFGGILYFLRFFSISQEPNLIFEASWYISEAQIFYSDSLYCIYLMIFFGIFIGLETFYMVSNLLSICWIFLTKNTTISIEVN